MTIKEATYLVGIDPGVKTGIAVYSRMRKSFLLIGTTSIIRAQNYMADNNHKSKMFVRLEDARKRTWFGKSDREQLQGAGSIKRDCQIWEEFFLYHGIAYELVAPKNNKTKLNSEAFLKITGWKDETSVHGRDAAMLVFGF